MRLAVLKERAAAETRVAATPDTVKRLVALGLTVAVEAGAGQASAMLDAEYQAAGAEIAPDAGAADAGAPDAGDANRTPTRVNAETDAATGAARDIATAPSNPQRASASTDASDTPRVARIRRDKPAAEADRLETLLRHIDGAPAG